MRRAEPRCRGERGATLVLVLVILAVFGLVLVAVASFGATEIRAGVAYRTQRQRAVAAEGAVNGAINYLRADLVRGREGVACPTFDFPFEEGTAHVTCTPRSGSGKEGFEEPDAATLAGYALVTTSGLTGYPAGPNDGIYANGNGIVTFGGPVISNSTVTMDHPVGTLSTDDALVVSGACNGNVVGNPLRCNLGRGIPEPGGGPATDPAPGTLWSSSVQSRPPDGSVVCDATTKVATMSPGTFTAPPDLTVDCDVLWMRPGDYYLDFLTSTTWSVGYRLIGGTPSGWDPAQKDQTPPTYDPAHRAGGACDPAGPGVHLVFGGDSVLLATSKAYVELCGGPAGPSRLPIVIYGRKGPTTATARSATYRPAAPPVTDPRLAAVDHDGGPATYTSVTLGSKGSRTTTLTGYGLSDVPAGSTLTKATVRVSHGEVTDDGKALAEATVTVKVGSATLCSADLPLRPTVTTDAFSCALPPWTAPADATATLTFTAKSKQTATVSLDGAELDLEWAEPGLRAQAMGLPFLRLQSGGGNSAMFFVRGTVYAPRGSVDLGFKNNNGVAFTDGAVLHSLRAVNIPPSQEWDPFSVATPSPSPITYDDRKVSLTATIDGVRQVRAVVLFADDKGRDPGRSVSVLGWIARN